MITLISHGLRESSLSILASNSYIYKQKPKTTKKTTTRVLALSFFNSLFPSHSFLAAKISSPKAKKNKIIIHIARMFSILSFFWLSTLALRQLFPKSSRTHNGNKRGKQALGTLCLFSFLLQTLCLILTFVPLLPFPKLSMSPFL